MSCNCQQAASILGRCYGQAQPRPLKTKKRMSKQTKKRMILLDDDPSPPKARGEKKKRMVLLDDDPDEPPVDTNLRNVEERVTGRRVTPMQTAPKRGNLQQQKKKKKAFDLLKERQFDRFVASQLDDDELAEYTARRRQAINIPRKVRRQAMGLPRRESKGRKGKRRGK